MEKLMSLKSVGKLSTDNFIMNDFQNAQIKHLNKDFDSFTS